MQGAIFQFFLVVGLAIGATSCAPSHESEPKTRLDGLSVSIIDDDSPVPTPSAGTESHCPDEFNRLLVPYWERGNPNYFTADQWWTYWEGRWNEAGATWNKKFPREQIDACMRCLREKDYAACQFCRNWEETERWWKCSHNLALQPIRNRLGAGVLFCGEAVSFEEGCGRLRWRDGPAPGQ